MGSDFTGFRDGAEPRWRDSSSVCRSFAHSSSGRVSSRHRDRPDCSAGRRPHGLAGRQAGPEAGRGLERSVIWRFSAATLSISRGTLRIYPDGGVFFNRCEFYGARALRGCRWNMTWYRLRADCTYPTCRLQYSGYILMERTMTASEIHFAVSEDELDGGYLATVLGFGIHPKSDTIEDFRQNDREAVDC